MTGQDGLEANRRELKAHVGVDPDADTPHLDKIISDYQRTPRARRNRAMTQISEVMLAVYELHLNVTDVAGAAQHDGADRYEKDLREGARLLNLVADEIAKKELRRVK
jgi:hypothetical protein